MSQLAINLANLLRGEHVNASYTATTIAAAFADMGTADISDYSTTAETADAIDAAIVTAFGEDAAALVAFHGATPVDQRASAAQAAVPTDAATDTAPFGFTEAQANAIVTLVNELRAALVEKGLIKGAA